MVTKEDCLRGGHFRYLLGKYKGRDELKQVRSSGQCKTWKTRPAEFRLPVKYGMYESLYITDKNAHEFITEDEYQRRKEQANALGTVLGGVRDNPMQLKSLGANQTEIVLDDGTTVFFSYQTPVAAHVSGEGFYKTEKKWSVTTSRHINNFIGHHGGSGKVTLKPQAWFDGLVATSQRVRSNPARRRRKAINDPLVVSEYSKMRRSGVGGVVGEDAKTSLRLARARAAYMRRDDVTIEWIPEQESYQDVYGEAPPKGAEYYTVVVKIDGHHAASLGFVDDTSKAYMRQVENELLAEAFDNEKQNFRRRHGLSSPRSNPSRRKTMTRRPIKRNPAPRFPSLTEMQRAQHQFYARGGYGKGTAPHPSTKSMPVQVQLQIGRGKWQSVAWFKDTPEAPERARRYANVIAHHEGKRARVVRV